MRSVPPRLLLLFALLPVAAGCTAAKASIQLVSAEQALTRAESLGAPEGAAYEYTMAWKYLEKAREEVGYNEYRIADALARQSAAWSDRAVIFIEKRGKTSFDLDDLTDLPAEPIVPPPDVPPPAPSINGSTPTDPAEDTSWLEPSEPVEPLPAEEPADEPEEPAAPNPFEIEEEDDEIELGEDPE